jgi:hypothetical protein
VLPMNEFLIYIRKNYMVLSNLGFHLNTGVSCSLCDATYDYMLMIYMLNEIIDDTLLIK